MSSGKAGFAILAAAAALLAAAPATAGPAANPGDTLAPPQGSSVAKVDVNNFNVLDVEVYAVTEEGRKFPLGVVNAGGKRSLALPNQIMSGATPFRLKIYSIQPVHLASAYRRYVDGVKTAVISGNPGSAISLIVGDPLTDSYINYVH